MGRRLYSTLLVAGLGIILTLPARAQTPANGTPRVTINADHVVCDGTPQAADVTLALAQNGSYFAVPAVLTYTLPNGALVVQRQTYNTSTGKIENARATGPVAIGAYPFTVQVNYNDPRSLQIYSQQITGVVGTGTLTIIDPNGPAFADNPFPVPYQQAPTDPYHFWRFDPTNRAEVQDAYWREEMVAATVPLGWNGSFATLEPGKTTQAWRNAVLREVNLHRYMYGNGSNFLVEDPSYNPTLQAGAFIGAWREALTHTLTAAMMPAGFAYTNQAITCAANNSLGLAFGGMMATDSTWLFMAEGTGNPDAGHRLVFLNPHVTITGTGDTPRKTGADPTSSFSTALHFASPSTLDQPLPVGDPFATYLTWPRKNSFTTLELMGYTQALISLDVYAGGLTLDASDVQVTVTINGQQVITNAANGQHAPYNITTKDAGSARQWLIFGVDHMLSSNYTNVPGISGLVLANDYVFEVTVTNLRMSRTFSFLTPAQMAQIDPRAFQNHTLKWSFTVFDPLIVKPASYTSNSSIAGLSTRAAIGSGDNVLIAGVIVSGTDPLKVAFRAQGPSLAQAGIQHPATNPKLDIYQSITGGSTLLGSNNGWKNGVNWRLVQSYSLNPTSDLESVAVATLAPGLYTAVVSDTGAGGVGIVEAYAIDPQSSSQLTAVSTRGVVGTGENVMIAGIITQQQQTVVVRTQGPALAALGVAGTVYSTRLSIYRQSDGKLLYQNSGWDAPGNERFHSDLASWVAGLSPTREAALVLTLPAGAYTAIVETPNGAPGVGIVEIYQVN